MFAHDDGNITPEHVLARGVDSLADNKTQQPLTARQTSKQPIIAIIKHKKHTHTFAVNRAPSCPFACFVFSAFFQPHQPQRLLHLHKKKNSSNTAKKKTPQNQQHWNNPRRSSGGNKTSNDLTVASAGSRMLKAPAGERAKGREGTRGEAPTREPNSSVHKKPGASSSIQDGGGGGSHANRLHAPPQSQYALPWSMLACLPCFT